MSNHPKFSSSPEIPSRVRLSIRLSRLNVRHRSSSTFKLVLRLRRFSSCILARLSRSCNVKCLPMPTLCIRMTRWRVLGSSRARLSVCRIQREVRSRAVASGWTTSGSRTTAVFDLQILQALLPTRREFVKLTLFFLQARGALCVAEDIAAALESGHIAGYAGDVWNQQPAPKVRFAHLSRHFFSKIDDFLVGSLLANDEG